MAKLTLEKQKEIDLKIDQIKLDYGFSYPANTLTEITSKIGIEVIFGKLPNYENKKVKGLIDWGGTDIDKPKIYVNSEQSDTSQAFTLAHELGHYFLHGKDREQRLRVDLFDYSSELEPVETEANYFAGALLMPKEILERLLTLTTDLSKIADYFAVSVPAVETRIKWMQKN